MRNIYLLTSAILAMVVVAAPSVAQDIEIDDIEANDAIYGHVIGLSEDQRDQYKVVVYVHTDQWYIHPYAGQGEGKSWATVAADDSWIMPTVRREFTADSVAALLVDREMREPSRVSGLAEIPAIARRVLDLLSEEHAKFHGRL